MRVFAPALSKAHFEQLLCASAVEQEEERQVVEITIREQMKASPRKRTVEPQLQAQN